LKTIPSFSKNVLKAEKNENWKSYNFERDRYEKPSATLPTTWIKWEGTLKLTCGRVVSPRLKMTCPIWLGQGTGQKSHSPIKKL